MFSKTIFVTVLCSILATLPAKASYDAYLNQSANFVLAAPNGSSGAMYPRLLVAADIPALPYASSTLASADLYIGNGSNVATATPMSGDATISNTGALTLATVNSNVGSFTFASITVNAKGLVTAASSGTPPISPTTKSKTTTYTAVVGDVVLADATSAGFTVTLPSAASSTNGVIWVKKVDSTSHSITISAAGSDTIDGQSSQIISQQYDDVEMISDGVSHWEVL